MAGGQKVNAFRAGSFGFNRDTLRALARNRIAFDSSYNASMFGPECDVTPEVVLVEPAECDGVYEYPMTVFHGGTATIAACTGNRVLLRRDGRVALAGAGV